MAEAAKAATAPADARGAVAGTNRATDADADWWQTGVVYQIYPRSFADSDGNGIGDLAGIASHLDHLAGAPDSLGIDAVWLSPIYPSPDFDFGYDVSDYLGVDPRYGTLEDFERLVEAAHGRGLRIILDLVLNHSSHEHPWFKASRASRDGEYADWYIWRDSPGRTRTGRRRPPNNWRSYFGGSAWTWVEERQQFYMHTFLPEQPDLNWRNPETRAALMEVVRTWLDRGVDGFRLDVFNTFFKDPALRSNPRRVGRRGRWTWQHHRYDRNQAELRDVLHDLRADVDARPGRMTVGELFDDSMVDAVPYIERGHLVFDWTFINIPWSAAAFRRAIAARDAAFGPDRWPANVLSNHDQPRHGSRFGAGVTAQVGDARAKVAAAMLLTLRGTPFLYYGEELGLRNLVIPNAEAQDPPARRASWLFPWWNRDQARGPMPWTPGPRGGFTTGRPWLPLPADAEARNVEREAADADSILWWYRRLLELRRGSPSLRAGGQRLVEVGNADVLAYIREGVATAAAPRDAAAARALVLLNFGSSRARLRPEGADAGAASRWRVALCTESRRQGEVLGSTIDLGPLEAVVAIEG